MILRLLSSVILLLALGAAFARNPAASPSQSTGEHPDCGGFSRMEPAMPGILGTVAQVAGNYYTIKTEKGELFTVHFSANTRIYMEPIRRPGERRPMRGSGWPDGPQKLRPSDIKVGSVIVAHGNIDRGSNTIGAVRIVQLKFEDAKQLHQMEASYGKTWLVGRITAVDNARITLLGEPDHALHRFVANQHTLYRKRQEPLTLADIRTGCEVRVDGEVKNGLFLASQVFLLTLPPD